MAVLRLHGVGVAWAASAPLFDGVSLTLEGGFYGLVGANGAGKTTLLSVLSRERAPGEGTVALTPRNAVVVCCPQEVDRRDDDVDAFAARGDGLAAALRGRLGLDPAQLERWETLSPGERKRWQIASALAREPDVLLLDEPTNHLDREAREHLLGMLRRFSGLGVIVSHDRAVLDALTTATLRIHGRAVALWPGCFSEAKALWEQARTEEQVAHGAARDRVREAAARLDAARRAQAGAARNISTGRRMKDTNDSDARGIVASTRASWAAAKAGRVAASARTELTRAREAVRAITRDATLGGRVFANFERAPTPVLFHVEAPALGGGERAVLRNVCVSIRREDRVRIEGANGAGKTTLLEALVATSRHPDRLLYLPQDLPDGRTARTLDRLRAMLPEARGRALSIYAALGSDPERVLGARAGWLSPGEARKLVLAEALSRQVWALVVDEPTNHMDLPSIVRLESALAAYPGAVVLVTHDDAFAARVTTQTLRIRNGTVR